jgi:maleylpyruvate isomerase
VDTTPDLLDALDRQTTALGKTLDRLPDVGGASLCAGWTRGHVLTHLARNADGIAALVRAAVDDSGETMYTSDDQRDRDIDAGAGRDLATQVDDVRRTAVVVNRELRRLRPEHGERRMERTPGTLLVPARRLPFMRVREVVYHHVDLDVGFGFGDVEPELLAVFLEDEVKRLRHADPVPNLTISTTEGEQWTVGLGTAQVSGDRSAVLGWLARGLTTGVAGAPLPELPAGR